MPTFSTKSLERLQTCDPVLQALFSEVIKHWDCSIVYGHRGQEDQDRAFTSGNSTKPWPQSKHNSMPSLAIDAAPCVGDSLTWDTDICRAFGGFVLGVAAMLGLKIRWGGDWDGDRDLNDQTLNDLVHFEVTK